MPSSRDRSPFHFTEDDYGGAPTRPFLGSHDSIFCQATGQQNQGPSSQDVDQERWCDRLTRPGRFPVTTP
ncbi:hypothetical protein [Streptomyces sp. NPDC000133]|uniref:hypothetical protein n=1 Tax=Streptomyces sp. NPDC000133 TaxID=3364535 RepID=UPI0036AB3909